MTQTLSGESGQTPPDPQKHPSSATKHPKTPTPPHNQPSRRADPTEGDGGATQGGEAQAAGGGALAPGLVTFRHNVPQADSVQPSGALFGWVPDKHSADSVNASIAMFEPVENATFAFSVAPGLVRTSKLPGQGNRPFTGAVRGEVSGWSAKSRANMVKRLATLDYAPLFDSGFVIPAMVTLTMPGDWLTVAPDAATFKNQIKMFRKRWERKWGSPLIGVWKMEFQRRGAPHLHMLTVIPRGGGFMPWLSETWADVVAHPDPVERAKHVRAGTGVDVTDAMRAFDPKRIAVYFSKHGMFKDKEYQDQAPEEWEKKTGRIWGYWGIKPHVEQAEITKEEAIKIQRLMRRLTPRYRTTRKARRQRKPPVIDYETGEILEAPVYQIRRCGVRSDRARKTGHAGSGFQVVNDGAYLAAEIARYLDFLRKTKN